MSAEIKGITVLEGPKDGPFTVPFGLTAEKPEIRIPDRAEELTQSNEFEMSHEQAKGT